MVLEQIANLSVLNKGFSVRVRVTPPNFNGNMNIKKVSYAAFLFVSLHFRKFFLIFFLHIQNC